MNFNIAFRRGCNYSIDLATYPLLSPSPIYSQLSRLHETLRSCEQSLAGDKAIILGLIELESILAVVVGIPTS